MKPFPTGRKLGDALKRSALKHGLIMRIDPDWFAVAPALIADPSDIDEKTGVFFAQQGSVGRHHHPQAHLGAVFRKPEYILFQQWLPACQDHDRLSHKAYLIQYLHAFFSIKLSWIGPSPGGGPAVHTVEVAPARHLPGHKSQLTAMLSRLFNGTMHNDPLPWAIRVIS